ncbi:MAG TPA: LapA family protein [Patescibacteria group bacterium]|nr:LapA family protein [Patescibacteria group bacterium]
MNTKIVVALILIIIALVIALQNTANVPIHLLFWEFGMPRIVMILFTLVLGIIIGYVIATVRCGRKENRKTAPPPTGIDTP